MFDYMLSLVPPLYAKGKQFTGYVKAIADELEELVDASKDTSRGWITLHAGTYALRALGRNVGLHWPDWADNEQYRRLVLAMYIARNSSASYGDIQRILDLLTGVDDSAVLPTYPAGFEVNLLGLGVTEEQAELYASIVQMGTASGVGSKAYWSDQPYFSWQEDTNPLAGTWGDPWIQEIDYGN